MIAAATHTRHSGTVTGKRRKTILVVDDDPDILRLFERILPTLDVDFHTSADPAAAMRDIPTLKPDLVMLDIAMPVVSGFTVARTVATWVPDARIAYISSNAHTGQQLRAWRTGASAFLAKPLDLETLAQRVEHLLDHAPSAQDIVVIGDFGATSWSELLPTISHLANRLCVRVDNGSGVDTAVWIDSGKVADVAHGALRGKAALPAVRAIREGVYRISLESPSGTSLDIAPEAFATAELQD
ncbi:MAG: response regulator [Candidatus Dadabacteria bacterium]|nr:MAG: response regulator [Candidatus Dadabacteria bacterium]